MATLLFWGPYMAHKGVINHRREKQRIKNYERWEGLRDDYDQQRKVTRESRSMDIQRTGTWDGQQFTPSPYQDYDDNRSYVSLRDQQEANDARTGWRPQECWDGPRTQLQAQMTGQVQAVPQPQSQQHTHAHMPIPQPPQRHISMTPQMTMTNTNTNQSPNTSHLPLRSQKTGATWDEGLPMPLAVSRQSFEDYDHTRRYRPDTTQSMPVSREASLTRNSSFMPQDYFTQPTTNNNNASRQNSVTRSNPSLSRQASISRAQTPSGLRESTPAPAVAVAERPYTTPLEPQVTSIVELPKNEFGFVDPARIAAGGRMAELIERGY